MEKSTPIFATFLHITTWNIVVADRAAHKEVNMTFYREVQDRKPVWVYVVVFAVAINAWAGFIRQIIRGKPYGTNPAPDWLVWLLMILVGLLLPAMLFMTRLIIELRDDAIHIQYVPFMSRSIPYESVVSFEQRTYNPIMEYGGWGIRGFGSGKRAYSMRGNEGVELTLNDGQKVMLGSERPGALAEAMARKFPS
jgi:hypothetical protein